MHAFAVIDPAAGISGDMLLGALVDAGADLEWLAGLPARLGLTDVRVEVQRVQRAGISATKVTVVMPDGATEGPAELVGAAAGKPPHRHHGAGREHHHAGGAAPHRHVAELLGVIEAADLSAWVRDRAVRAFRLLAEAEGRVHGVPAEQVALHEVGAVDALVDIVGGIEGFERLGVTDIRHLPVAAGSGWVRAAHGTIPVPAPATAVLLEGMMLAANGPVTGEATTPTGAVLLRVLSQGPPPAGWTLRTTGWGAGTRDPEHYPNVLRLVLGEAALEAAQVVTLATDVDDLSPEYLEPLREALTGAGALDVQVWVTHMKKGRTAFRIEISAPPAAEDAVVDALFKHSTTAGVRRWRTERVTLPRRELTLDFAGARVRIKVLDTPDGPRPKPEYEDLLALAQTTGRPVHELSQEIRQRARDILADEAR